MITFRVGYFENPQGSTTREQAWARPPERCDFPMGSILQARCVSPLNSRTLLNGVVYLLSPVWQGTRKAGGGGLFSFSNPVAILMRAFNGTPAPPPGRCQTTYTIFGAHVSIPLDQNASAHVSR